MWPKYPKQTSRWARSANIRRTYAGWNGGAASAYGPSLSATALSAAAATAKPLAAARTVRHPTPDDAFRRCGEPEPRASAPISAPTARPRPERNHEAISLIPGG